MGAEARTLTRFAAADYAAVQQLLARYCWCADTGDTAGWLALWTEDGTLRGIGDQPIVGHQALRAIPEGAASRPVPAGLRHLFGSLVCEYEDTPDRARARYYNLVTTWFGTGELSVMAICEARLVRHDEDWLIQENTMTLLPVRESAPAGAAEPSSNGLAAEP